MNLLLLKHYDERGKHEFIESIIVGFACIRVDKCVLAIQSLGTWVSLWFSELSCQVLCELVPVLVRVLDLVEDDEAGLLLMADKSFVSFVTETSLRNDRLRLAFRSNARISSTRTPVSFSPPS